MDTKEAETEKESHILRQQELFKEFLGEDYKHLLHPERLVPVPLEILDGDFNPRETKDWHKLQTLAGFYETPVTIKLCSIDECKSFGTLFDVVGNPDYQELLNSNLDITTHVLTPSPSPNLRKFETDDKKDSQCLNLATYCDTNEERYAIFDNTVGKVCNVFNI